MARQKTNMDMKEMMEVYKKVGTPGEHHKLLASLEGSWTTKSRGWMDPEQPPMESTGTCEQKLILGGRFLQQIYTGDMGGEKFTGINIIGYDNHTKKFVSAWIETMSTGIYFFEGTAGKDGKTITQECRYDDPVKGPSVWKTVTRIKDDNTIEFEMYLTPRGRKEQKMMEMIVKRSAVSARAA